MRIILKLLKWLALLVVVLVIGAAGWLYFMPPSLLRVGTAYAAKIVCSNHFIAKRDPAAIFADDVQAPGHWLLGDVKVEQKDDYVTASLYGWVAPSYALYREGLGCTVVTDGDLDTARKIALDKPAKPTEPSEFEWPLGDEVSLPGSDAVKALIEDPTLAGPGMRAIVVVKNGRLIAETYGKGFTQDTPLMGWSMTKTVTAALIAERIAQGKLGWEQDHLFPDWADDRAKIKIADLMAMQSGLQLVESYGDVNDVTRMLFLEPDQARFVIDHPLETQPGTKFNYATGNAVLLTRLWMDTFSDLKQALAYPRQALFDPIGMRSAVMETDESGHFSGGSLMYATARDWARFGLLLANKGDWNGVQVLPADFVERMGRATQVSGGVYTEAMTWKPAVLGVADASTLPADAFWAQGHDGQWLVVVPSEGLVIVRLGLTPSRLGYKPTALIGKVIEAARAPLPEAPTDNLQPKTDAQPEDDVLPPD